jgi:hypothetical protein
MCDEWETTSDEDKYHSLQESERLEQVHNKRKHILHY